MESGKLHFMSGKGELIYEGAFDDIDMAMQMHADKKYAEAYGFHWRKQQRLCR